MGPSAAEPPAATTESPATTPPATTPPKAAAAPPPLATVLPVGAAGHCLQSLRHVLLGPPQQVDEASRVFLVLRREEGDGLSKRSSVVRGQPKLESDHYSKITAAEGGAGELGECGRW